MKRTGRILRHLVFAVLAIALVLAAAGAYCLKVYLPRDVASRSFPQTRGVLHLKGLDRPVDVYRDRMGIPHIYARTLHDLFFAQGYVHAQDRFWQMDVWRHVGSGTLSEMFGAREVKTDAFLRTLGWRRTAQAEWDGMGPESRAILTSYTAGVNAYLRDHRGAALSLEYSILHWLSPGYRVAPWTPINSLTWGKTMAWDLRGNLGKEIERAVLLKTLTPKQVRELFPPYPSDHPTIVGSSAAESATDGPAARALGRLKLPAGTLSRLSRNVSRVDAAIGPAGTGIGSNAWAVSGKRTATGMPLLANDPHLGIQMPSIWYQVDMHCVPKSRACPFEVAGFSFAGVPGVIIGHNDRIAWGFTNTGPDVMDLFIEKVNPHNPDQYLDQGKWVNFHTRKATIEVAGGKPVTITVRATRHGPVISGTYRPLESSNPHGNGGGRPFRDRAGIPLPRHYVLALDWTALKPSSPFEAIWGFDKARDWQQFRAAARYFHAPAQNLVYADTRGNIGYQMPGDIPIRKHGNGRLPVPGWSGRYDWTGYIPFDRLPHVLNPPDGYIATANNKVAPDSYPYLITTDWDYGFRANRIVDLIRHAPGKIDVAYFRKIQGDMYDASAATLVPLLLKLGASFDREQRRALELLAGWNDQDRAASAAAALYESFWRHLLQDTFDDDLPQRYWPRGGSRWFEVMRNLVRRPDDAFWDDRTTRHTVERRDDILKRAFRQAVAEMHKRFGSDPSKWSWGRMHTATFRNRTLGKTGFGPVDRLFDRGPYPVGGSGSTIDATGWAATHGYRVNWLPSMRMIVDLGNLDRSITVHTTGESGHAYASHYVDMAPMWAGLRYYPMLWKRAGVEARSKEHLRLVP